jgi:hypothetical protein
MQNSINKCFYHNYAYLNWSQCGYMAKFSIQETATELATTPWTNLKSWFYWSLLSSFLFTLEFFINCFSIYIASWTKKKNIKQNFWALSTRAEILHALPIAEILTSKLVKDNRAYIKLWLISPVDAVVHMENI